MTSNELADALEDKSIRYSESVQDWLDEAKNMLRQQAQEIKNRNMDIDALRTFNNDLETEIEALKKAIVEYADCVGSIEGKDFIGDLKYMGTSKESIALLYKLNGYDENGKEMK